jgi:hypothetical protein
MWIRKELTMKDDDFRHKVEKLIKEFEETGRPGMLEAVKYERLFEYEKWLKKLAELKPVTLPDNCGITPVPPFAGTVTRFFVRCLETDNQVSVYLDCYHILGYFCRDIDQPEPYWEIYPYPFTKKDGTIDYDTNRYAMSDIAGLSKGIAESIAYLRSSC